MKKPLVVFDMDGVLIEHRSSWRMLHDALGTNNNDSYQAYMRGEIDDLEFMRRDIRRWLRSKPDMDIEFIRSIFDSQKRMNGFAEGIHRLKDSGAAVFILSGGIDVLANALCRVSGMDGSYANGVIFDDEGRLTGEGILRVPLRDKGWVLKDKILGSNEYGPIISVGDSHVDITMFENSDLSIAFRPESDPVSEAADITIRGSDLTPVIDVILEYLTG